MCRPRGACANRPSVLPGKNSRRVMPGKRRGEDREIESELVFQEKVEVSVLFRLVRPKDSEKEGTAEE